MEKRWISMTLAFIMLTSGFSFGQKSVVLGEEKTSNQVVAIQTSTDTGKFLAPIESPDQNAILIHNAQELSDIRNNLSGSYVLVNDIDLASWGDWTPLGSYFSPFTGIFDGQGHIIKNFHVSVDTNDSYDTYIGLFGRGRNAQFLNIEISNISNLGNSPKGYNIGGVVGSLESGIVYNCFNTNSDLQIFEGYGYLGGIAGIVLNNTQITNCYNTSSLISNAETGYYGGGDAVIGGIVAVNRNSSVSKCYNTGDLESNSHYAKIGGITGYTENGSILECFNKGNVSSRAFPSGGISGGLYVSTLSNCYNTGKVSLFEATIGVSSYYSGGISGYANDQVKFQNCYNAGIVDSSFDPTLSGGFSGAIYNDTVIDNCYFLNSTATHPIAHDHNIFSILSLSSSELHALAPTLGNAFTSDDTGINNGYPILEWQLSKSNTSHIELSEPHDIIVNGEPLVLIATVYDGTGSAPYEIQEGVSWSFEPAGIVERTQYVDSGVCMVELTGRKVGTVKVTASKDGISASVDVNVVEKTDPFSPTPILTVTPTITPSPTPAQSVTPTPIPVTSISPTITPTPITQNSTKGIKEAINKWVIAYGAYKKAVASQAETLTPKIPDAEKEKQLAEKADDLLLISLDPDMSQEAKRYCKLAVMQMIESTSYFQNQKFSLKDVDLSKTKIEVGVKIAKNVNRYLTNLYTVDNPFKKTYDNGNYNISVYMFASAGDAFTGVIACTDSKKPGSYLYNMFSSSYNQTTKAIDEFMKVLIQFEKTIVIEYIKSVLDEIKEFFGFDGSPLEDYKEQISNENNNYLKNLKFGDVNSMLSNCYDYFKYMRKVINFAKADLSDPDLIDQLNTLITDADKIDFLAGGNEKIQDKVIKDVVDKLVDAKDDIKKAFENYKSGYPDTPKDNNSPLRDFFSYLFKCPVDIYVYNSEDEEVGHVVADEVYYSDDIYIEKVGTVKTVYVPKSEKVRIEAIGTADGILNFVLEEYADGQPVERMIFYDISLYPGKDIWVDSNFDSISQVHDNFSISADNVRIRPDEVLSANELVSVKISLESTKGGATLGDDFYLKGDPIYLLAFADEGYSFTGWYLSDKLLSNAGIYEMTARDDLSLVAKFIPNSADIISPSPTPSLTPLPTYTPSYNGGVNYNTSPASPPTEPTSIPSVTDALYKLGLFVGTGTDTYGKPIYDLDKKLTRLEALALVIRLMGLEKETTAYTGTNTFTDVPPWGDRYAAYGYSIGITAGINNEHTLFAPDRQVTFQEFTAFLLRVLGYTEANGDFEYANTASKGASIGLFSPYDITKIQTNNFLRENAVYAMADALETKSKGTDALLLYKLADKGVFSKADADWFAANIK